jgi:exopolysaccharide biosynthesis polyprenyl glycosylphosphotransferase
MLKRHATFFVLLRSVLDILIIAGTWMGVYFLRFKSGFFESPKGIPAFGRHLMLMFPILAISFASCVWAGLYKTKRLQNLFMQFADIFRAALLSGLFVLALLYYLQDAPYSRKLLILFVPMLLCGLLISHVATMGRLRQLRQKGYNLRHCAIIGAGKRGQQLQGDLNGIKWSGVKCDYFIDNNADRMGNLIRGIPVYGPISETVSFVQKNPVDEVYLALSGDEASSAYPVLEKLQQRGITVRIIPDWGNLSLTHTTVVTVGSQILFCATDSPLSGYKIILKELFDIFAATVLLILLAVPMVLIAIAIKLTSKGPVFYKQKRLGMDQKEFGIYKFRTMRVDAESQNGPQWARPNDDRRTKIGIWLRSLSIDELPQLLNVLKGEMSLVGPRPERPCFAHEFSEEFRDYMLRHRVKAGMTGWAQIHGFRGNCSLKKRLQYDLFYVRNWSFGFDLRILLLTPWHILKGKNAY